MIYAKGLNVTSPKFQIPCVESDLSREFHENPFIRFFRNIYSLRAKLRNQQRRKYYLRRLTEVKGMNVAIILPTTLSPWYRSKLSDQDDRSYTIIYQSHRFFLIRRHVGWANMYVSASGFAPCGHGHRGHLIMSMFMSHYFFYRYLLMILRVHWG